MLNLKNLPAVLASQNLQFSALTVDGIPYLEVWSDHGLLSMKDALRITHWVNSADIGVIHFHTLEGLAISFFVFDNDNYSDEQFQNYGVPVTEWCPALVDDLPWPNYSRSGRKDSGSQRPSVDVIPGGAIWAFTRDTNSPFYEDFTPSETSGKWCIFCPASEIDALWEKIRKATWDGRLTAAKVSSRDKALEHGGIHVICVYNADYSNMDEVNASRQALGELGITEELGYKRDFDSMLGVYGDEVEWTYRY